MAFLRPRFAGLAALLLLAAGAANASPGSDRTLGTVSASCKDKFTTIMSDNYGDAASADCKTAITAALTTAPVTPADCPGGKVSDVGSVVQQCMARDANTTDAWTSFIMSCEVLNVNERAGAGEAEAAADVQPSCFPRFDSLGAFKQYLSAAPAAGVPAAATATAAPLAPAAVAAPAASPAKSAAHGLSSASAATLAVTVAAVAALLAL